LRTYSTRGASHDDTFFPRRRDRHRIPVSDGFGETPAPATPAPAAKAPVVHSAASLECSKEADAKGLHGKERKKFRSECKREAKGGAAKQ